MINNTQYVSPSFTLPGARAHTRTQTHTHSPLPAGRAMQRPTYPISLFLSPPVGGNNSGLTQPFPCEHKRPYHRHRQSPHLFCDGNVLRCSEKQFRVTSRNGKGMKDSESACNLQKWTQVGITTPYFSTQLDPFLCPLPNFGLFHDEAM